MNSATCLKQQVELLFECYKPISETLKLKLEQFRASLTLKCSFVDFRLEAVGSGSLGLLRHDSDLDIVFMSGEWKTSFLREGLRELGEQTVRAKRREGNDPRWDRPVTERLFTI